MPVILIHQCRFLLFIVFILLVSSISLTANALESNQVTKTPEQQIAYLVNLATQLTQQARSGDAAASSFRINVVFYRESLRDFMLEKPDSSKYSKALLMEFVRMSALLQSAAECQTGRFIVCPAELMIQLKIQQVRLVNLVSQIPRG